MSAVREVTQEDIKQLYANLLAEEEYFDSLAQLPEAEGEIYKQVSSSYAALIRSTGQQPGAIRAAEVHEGSLDIVYQKLQRYACDYIKAAYLLLQELKVDPAAREFVVMMLGASGGNSRQKLIITDSRLEEMTGYSEKTVRAKRQAYRTWEARAGWTVVRIHERPRDRETKRFYPTEYEVLFADHVTQFLREWRTYYQQRLSQPPAPDRDAESEAKDPGLWEERRIERQATVFAEATSEAVRRKIAERVIGDRMEMSPVPPRKVADHSHREPKSRLAQINAQILDLIARGRDEARREGKGALPWWVEVKRSAAIVLSTPTPGFPEPEDDSYEMV